MVDRATISFLQESRRFSPCSWNMRPLESGAGGCPWRTVLAVILRCNASQQVAGRVLGALLWKWPDPGSLAAAPRHEVRAVCELLVWGGRKARTVQAFSKAWVGKDWDTLLDLPGVGQTAAAAVERYGMTREVKQ